ncbi:MAG TPA: hypothetical protein VFK87_01265, partial [Steroidobacteraceae bacterium]|nr:hypothetical protein [Steroidobacteraceae bacterium]
MIVAGMPARASQLGGDRLGHQVLDRGLHDPQQRRRPHPDDEHRERQRAEHDELTAVEVRERRHLRVRDRAEHHALHQPQRVAAAEDQGHRGERRIPEARPEARDDHQELAHEARGAREPRVGEREQHHEGREHRHGIDHPAVVGDLAAVQAVIQHSDAQEQRPGDQPVRDHLHHGAVEPHTGALEGAGAAHDLVEHEGPESHEAHVGDRGVGDQLLHVLLHQRHEADVDHRDQRQHDHQHIELAARIRRHRQAEAQEAVAPHLEHDGREDHRAAGR